MPQPSAVRREVPPLCAAVPAAAAWLEPAIREGGGIIVAPEEAEAFFWFGGSPALLREHIERAPQVRLVQLPAAGIEAFLPVVDRIRTWTCAKGVYADAVAEHALALALCGLRNVASYGRRTTWSAPDGRNLVGARVLVVGGGGIAQRLVDLLQPFRARVTVIRRHPAPMPGVAQVLPPEALRSALPAADVVVLALALTEETRGVVGAEELHLMAPHAWLVNVARGGHVVTDDLTAALTTGVIAGAALDVTDPEPLPTGHPLWALDNCIITPHTANTPAMLRAGLDTFTRDTVRRLVAGEAPVGVVDPVLGY